MRRAPSPAGRPGALRWGRAALPGPAVFAVVGAAYFALAQYVIWLNDPVNAGAGYWPAAGVTLVALLVLPLRLWGWVIAAIVVAELAGDALHGYPLAASGWWAAGNVVEPVVAASLLRRFGHGGRLAPLANLVRFLAVGVVVGPLLGAAVGSIGTAGVYGVSQTDVLLKWWAGDGLGVLVVAPLLLSFRERAVQGRSPYEIAAVAVGVVAVSLLVFRNWHGEWDIVAPYLVFPVVMWASVRFGIRGAAIAGFGVAEIANLSTALGYGPFQLAGGPDGHAITALQVFLASALTAGLVIATLVNHTVDRAKVYERQRAVADALQAAVLPEELPATPDLTFAARYAPASSSPTVHVGGDWYDALRLSDGSTAIVMGDVAGHDVAAAAVMGQLRNGLRSLLLELDEPARVMAALDRQLAASGNGMVATVLIAVYAGGELRWVNAGHPPLLLAASGGGVAYLDDEPGPLLGTGTARYAVHRTSLDPGDVVIGYTDGLLEHRSWSLDEGFAHVARLVASAPARDPQAICELLLAEGLGGRPREDDACVLAVRRDH